MSHPTSLVTLLTSRRQWIWLWDTKHGSSSVVPDYVAKYDISTYLSLTTRWQQVWTMRNSTKATLTKSLLLNMTLLNNTDTYLQRFRVLTAKAELLQSFLEVWLSELPASELLCKHVWQHLTPGEHCLDFLQVEWRQGAAEAPWMHRQMSSRTHMHTDTHPCRGH